MEALEDLRLSPVRGDERRAGETRRSAVWSPAGLTVRQSFVIRGEMLRIEERLALAPLPRLPMF